MKKERKKKQYRIGSVRKRGSVIIETIAAIPVLVFLTWGILNLMLYAISSSQLNEAANETSRAIAMDLRGSELEAITANDVNADKVKDKIKLIIDSNSFIKLTKNEESYKALPIMYSEEQCKTELNNESVDAKNVLCVYVITKEDINHNNNYQISVVIRTDYKFSGGWGALFPTVTLKAKAINQVELPGRGNYVEF